MSRQILPHEARLLEVERRQVAIDEMLRNIRRQFVGAQQQTWDAWNDHRVRVQAAVPLSCTTDFASVCACLPLQLKVTDTRYGDTMIFYDPGNLWWTGCKQVSYPGTVLCAARSMPIWYYLFGDNTTNTWNLGVKWHGTNVGGNVCPTASKTCADTPNQSSSVNNSFFCSSPYHTTTWLAGASGRPWATGAGVTLTVADP